VPFETTVKASNGGFLESSKKELREYLDKKEKLDGSLFGKIKDFDFGEKEDLNIDKLISGINDALKEE
jgi:CRISPR system Cascade subunit CasC